MLLCINEDFIEARLLRVKSGDRGGQTTAPANSEWSEMKNFKMPDVLAETNVQLTRFSKSFRESPWKVQKSVFAVFSY